VQDVNDLMQHLIDVWAGLEQLMSLTSGAGISVPAFEPRNILNIDCDSNLVNKFKLLSLNLLLHNTFLQIWLVF